MIDPLYSGMEDVIQKIANDRLRDHIAHVLGPSPLTVRLREGDIFSREQARQIADSVVDEMEKYPEKASAILSAIYGREDSDDE